MHQWGIGVPGAAEAMAHWGYGEAVDPGIRGERAREKADAKYKGNAALLKDVSRFSIYYDDVRKPDSHPHLFPPIPHGATRC